MIKQIIFITFLTATAWANNPELTVGKFTYEEKAIKNAPWPQATIQTLLKNITPHEAAAIFSNYQDQKKFVPDVLESKIIKEVAPNDIHVAFRLDNPWPLDDEKYVTGNILTKENNSFFIRWYFVKSDTLIDTKGQIIFSEHPSGKTTMKYISFVHPKTRLAFLASPFIKSKLINSIKAIAKYLQKFKKKKPQELKLLIKKMDNILGNGDTNGLDNSAIKSRID